MSAVTTAQGPACVLAIAGLDPSGGAGLASDLRAIERAGAWACPVVAVLTVQSTAGLRAARPVERSLVVAQAREVVAAQRVRAIKTGALGSAANARAVARLARTLGPDVPLVVDPVLAPTRGAARLLATEALGAARALARVATLVTPNALEAGALLGATVRDLADARDAGRALVAEGARAALVKGGHLGGDEAVDVLVVGARLVELRARRVGGLDVHGTGCTLASLVAGRLATRPGRHVSEDEIVDAARWAKQALGRALLRPLDVGAGSRVIRP